MSTLDGNVPPGTPPPSPPPPQPRPPSGPGRLPRGEVAMTYPPREPFPDDAHGSCMVGEPLVPLFGRSWVDRVAAEGGLVPYLLRRALARLFPSRSPEAYR